MRFRFSKSHPYPGAPVSVSDDGPEGSTCLVEFGDGAEVIAGVQADGDAYVLDLPAYRTAKGTDVRSGRWALARSEAGAWRARRLPTP